MREILFRGKREGKWIKGSLVRFPDGTTEICYSGEKCDIDELDKATVAAETVGQFTGLTDKNGKRIFEGDIVRWPGRKEVGIVQYGEFNCSCCDGVFGWHFGTEDIRDHDSYEVIGNIHDNPELLSDSE